jgi:hypothetical protein
LITNSADSLVEHWDGNSWSVVSSPAFSGSRELNGISADGSGDIWAVGDAVVLHWNGQSWSSVVAPPPVGLSAVTALSPTNAWAVGSQRLSDTQVRAQVEHWDGTSWGIFINPNPGTSFSTLYGIAAVSASDIWAVGEVNGQTLTEHFDGTSWKIINSPNPGKGGNILFGATALSTGAVVAVGESFDSSGVSNGLILSNSWRYDQRSVPAPAAPTTAMPALLDAAAVDQFFAAVGKADQQLRLAYYSLRPRHTAANGDLDVLPGGLWLVEPA